MLIEWTHDALRDMKRVGDRIVQERIRAAIERFASSGHGDVKALKGCPGEYRLRVGDWRVRFTIDSRGAVRVMVILRVLPRGGAYD